LINYCLWWWFDLQGLELNSQYTDGSSFRTDGSLTLSALIGLNFQRTKRAHLRAH